MELIGEETKIQALFRELKLADESVTPGFTAVLSRAQAHTIRPRRAFNLSFVAAAAILVCTLAGLALWSRSSEQSQKANVVVPATPGAVVSSTPTDENRGPVDKPASPERHGFSAKERLAKNAARRRAAWLAANRAVLRDAQAISRWQSPTTALLSSSSDEILTSLPQLNENTNDLKSFLPSQPK